MGRSTLTTPARWSIVLALARVQSEVIMRALSRRDYDVVVCTLKSLGLSMSAMGLAGEAVGIRVHSIGAAWADLQIGNALLVDIRLRCSNSVNFEFTVIGFMPGRNARRHGLQGEHALRHLHCDRGREAEGGRVRRRREERGAVEEVHFGAHHRTTTPRPSCSSSPTPSMLQS